MKPDGISIAKTILSVLWEAGEITVKAFFPHPYSHLFCNHKQPRSIQLTFNRMEHQGSISRKKDSSIFYLTKKGTKEAFLAHIGVQSNLYRKPKQWDGLWRMVMFDVPETRRDARDYLRDTLKGLGFHALQRSIWVSRYPIPDFIQEILEEYNLLRHTRIITVHEINYDDDLRKKVAK